MRRSAFCVFVCVGSRGRCWFMCIARYSCWRLFWEHYLWIYFGQNSSIQVIILNEMYFISYNIFFQISFVFSYFGRILVTLPTNLYNDCWLPIGILSNYHLIWVINWVIITQEIIFMLVVDFSWAAHW